MAAQLIRHGLEHAQIRITFLLERFSFSDGRIFLTRRYTSPPYAPSPPISPPHYPIKLTRNNLFRARDDKKNKTHTPNRKTKSKKKKMRKTTLTAITSHVPHLWRAGTCRRRELENTYKKRNRGKKHKVNIRRSGYYCLRSQIHLVWAIFHNGNSITGSNSPTPFGMKHKSFTLSRGSARNIWSRAAFYIWPILRVPLKNVRLC